MRNKFLAQKNAFPASFLNVEGKCPFNERKRQV
jgi:hypothetical protein